MSPFLLVTVVIVVLMAKRLADIYVRRALHVPLVRSEKRTTPLQRLSLEPSALRVSGPISQCVAA